MLHRFGAQLELGVREHVFYIFEIAGEGCGVVS